MATVEIVIQMHLHDAQCGCVDDSGNRLVPEDIDMVGNWFVYSAPGSASTSMAINSQGIVSEIRRHCRLIRVSKLTV